MMAWRPMMEETKGQHPDLLPSPGDSDEAPDLYAAFHAPSDIAGWLDVQGNFTGYLLFGPPFAGGSAVRTRRACVFSSDDPAERRRRCLWDGSRSFLRLRTDTLTARRPHHVVVRTLRRAEASDRLGHGDGRACHRRWPNEVAW